MAYYKVPILVPDTDACWNVRVVVEPEEHLTHAVVLGRAREIAVDAFGPDALTWPFIFSNYTR